MKSEMKERYKRQHTNPKDPQKITTNNYMSKNPSTWKTRKIPRNIQYSKTESGRNRKSEKTDH